MWIREHSKFYPGVKAKDIWEILIDINNWPKWHDDLESCQLHGEFKVGSFFYLKPKGGPKVKISLTEINEGHSFTDCTHFFAAKMYDTHIIEEQDGGVLFRNKLVVTGSLKWLWIFLVAKNVAQSVPEENDRLVKIVREKVKL